MTTTLKNSLFFCLTVFVFICCNSSGNQTTANAKPDSIAMGNQPINGSRLDTSKPDNDTTAVDSLFKIKVLTKGNFHSDEVWETASKEKWFGLFKGKETVYLKETIVKTKRVHDVVVDENDNEKTGWEVSTSNKDSCIILMAALPYSTDRKIQSVTLSKNMIFPGETLDVSYLGNQYKIFATGEKRKNSKTLKLMKCKIINYT